MWALFLQSIKDIVCSHIDGAVGVTRTKGSVKVTGRDGEPVSVPFQSVEMVRKQPDGTWLFVIDDPAGDGAQ